MSCQGLPIETAFLADHPEAIPILKEHLESEWDGWYGPNGPGDAETDLLSFSNRDRLPIGLLALLNHEVVGLAALKPESIDTHNHLSPWAAAGWVVPELRGQGIGGMLLQVLENLAKDLGYSSIYCGTSTATGLLERNGWERLETVPYHGEQVSIFRKVL
ncbi:MAG: GNAT family N-acetyltransferase [Candidatus Omnitrophica bacterium]|nr:GNAT family N-acetyltransferase [Candidatus Omnitrophota bacterium]MCA9447957.1 GNAT family N-acetyltransferase [Candidatus Omnitrophota bacterium]